MRRAGGPLFIAVRGPLTIAASLVAEHRLQMCRLSSCGARAQPLHGMWDLPRPGLEPVSPALAGRFSTTVPPGKPPGSVSLGPSLIHAQKRPRPVTHQLSQVRQEERQSLHSRHPPHSIAPADCTVGCCPNPGLEVPELVGCTG